MILAKPQSVRPWGHRLEPEEAPTGPAHPEPVFSVYIIGEARGARQLIAHDTIDTGIHLGQAGTMVVQVTPTSTASLTRDVICRSTPWIQALPALLVKLRPDGDCCCS
jgi:hypothetical protein